MNPKYCEAKFIRVETRPKDTGCRNRISVVQVKHLQETVKEKEKGIYE